MRIVLTLMMLLGPLASNAARTEEAVLGQVTPIGVTDAEVGWPGLGAPATAGQRAGTPGPEQFGRHQGAAIRAAGGNSELVGLWRSTRIVFDSPRDDFLELLADGTAAEWSATAGGQGPKTTGRWTTTEKELTITWSTGDRWSNPFTFYEGDLVFPNIQGSRKFWERIQRR